MAAVSNDSRAAAVAALVNKAMGARGEAGRAPYTGNTTQRGTRMSLPQQAACNARGLPVVVLQGIFRDTRHINKLFATSSQWHSDFVACHGQGPAYGK